MKPVVGITLSMEPDEKFYSVHSDNPKAIMRSGGVPILLPYYGANKDIEQIAQTIDGLVTTGGDDIDPTFFGEEPHRKLGPVVAARDQFEIAITKQMLKLNKPILGICRGAQILNIAAGGDMYQDIYDQIDNELLQHAQTAPRGHGSHYVNVLESSLLHKITNSNKIRVNSRHHQANRKVPDHFQICGTASDGVVEAIESKDHKFALGLQWHPESMLSVDDDISMRIFSEFLQACSE